jgi:hypothetical protein
MTSQALIELVPETASGEIVAGGTSRPIGATGTGPAGIGATGTEATAATETRVVAWRRPAPPIPLRQRIAGWRARHWRRLVLGWFVLSLAIVAVAAEPRTDFPKAQAGTVPAVRTVLQVAGGLTVAGVPFVLIVLP